LEKTSSPRIPKPIIGDVLRTRFENGKKEGGTSVPLASRENGSRFKPFLESASAEKRHHVGIVRASASSLAIRDLTLWNSRS